jgi:hypothetical protein
MTLEHVAIWTDNLEELKDYYIKYLVQPLMKNTRMNKVNFKAIF